MNKKLLCILLALVLVCSIALTACNLTPEKVTITYKYNYEGAPADKTVTLDKGANITLDTPTRTDYKFDGWFTDAACTKAFTDKVANANVTLYAKWTASHTHDLHYQSSSSKHWQECSCGYTAEQVDHTFDANNTCVCGYKQGGTAHTHSWATDWSKDATNHWHVCTGCSELNDKAAHDTNGTDGACSVCGYKAQAQGQAVTVYFYTADWTTVNAYAWTDTPSFAEHLGAWPGTAINAVAGEEGWYSVEVPADTQKIIFNDGSNQTNDLLVADGPYFYRDNGYATKGEAEEAISKPVEKVTLYYYNNLGWEEVYGYSWTPESLGTYPGTKLAAIEDGSNWYSVEMDLTVAGFQFNNGKSGDEERKTIDLTLEDGKTYYYAGTWYATQAEAEEAFGQEPVTTITLRGSWSTNWSEHIAFEAHNDNEVKIENFEMAAGTEFKVVISVTGQEDEWINTLKEGVTVATHATEAADSNIVVAEAGNYNLYFDITTKELWIEKVVEEHEHVTEGTYVYDDNGHWVVCTCGEKVLEAEHVPGAEATETEPQICTVCEKVLVPALGHEHVTEGTYEHDENGHWVVCSCEEKVLVGEHDTEGKDGACSVCGYTKPVEPEKVTVYFQNNWLWTDVKAYYWTTEGEDIVENGTWPGVAMTLVVNDGTYDIYSVEVPVNVTGLVISGIKDDGSGTLDQTPNITIENKTCVMYYMVWNEKSDVEVASYHTETTETVKEADCTNAGEKKHTCSVCGNVRTEVVAAGHTFVEGVCSVCGEQESAEVEDKAYLMGLAAHAEGLEMKKEDGGYGEEYTAIGFVVVEGDAIIVKIGENEYGFDAVEDGVSLGQTAGANNEIVLPAGEYNLYFKTGTESMWIEAVKAEVTYDACLVGLTSYTEGFEMEKQEGSFGEEYKALGFSVLEGDAIIVKIGENEYGFDYVEDGVSLGQTAGANNEIVLPAGEYNLYFKTGTESMWIEKAPCKVHKPAEDYSTDSKEHWHACTVCGEAIADTKGTHDTDGENGVCSVCGFDPSQVVEATVLYLTPNANWKKDGARFAAYFFGNGEVWVDMTDEDGDGIYEVVVPEGFVNIIFCRMNPSAAANNWTNKWNQTEDLKVPTDGTNMFTVKDGAWDKGGGTWTALAE